VIVQTLRTFFGAAHGLHHVEPHWRFSDARSECEFFHTSSAFPLRFNSVLSVSFVVKEEIAASALND